MEPIKRYILAVLFFSIPLYPKLTSLCIIAYAILTLFSLNKKSFSILWQRKELALFVVIYLILLIGLSYTINLEIGLSKVQTQASFLVFPIFFINSFYGNEDRNHFFQYFNWGLLVAIVICLFNALKQLVSGDGMYIVDAFSKKHNVFLYQEFSSILNLHPTYFSLYLGLALFYLIFAYNNKSGSKPILKWVMIIVFFIALFLTSSKAGIFSFILISLIYQLVTAIRGKKKSELLIFPILILGFVLMFIVNPLIYKRSIQAIKSINAYSVTDGEMNESTSKRFSLWHVSLKSIEKKMFFGYGTGSVTKALNDSCIEFFSFSTCEGIRNKNTHSQYLNMLLSNGLLIFLPFLLALFLALRKAILNKDPLYFLFTLFLIINCFFESLLERERGVVFLMLFMVFLNTTSDPGTKEINE